MHCITITYGYYALNDILTEDTDKPTNPWLDLILESNKNKKEPTKLWNLVQNEIANIKKFRLDEQSAVRYARRIFGDQYELPFKILCNISALEYTATINLGNTRLINVNFRNAKFNLPVDFVRSHFEKAVIFDNAYFCEEADFTDCIFDKAVSFDRTRFGKFAKFTNDKFAVSSKKNCDDQKLLFNVRFEADANFEHSEFGGPLEFRFDGINGRKEAASVWFNKAKFFKNVSFLQIDFDVADFGNAVFEGSAYFHRVSFCGYTNFEEVNFRELVWFGSKKQTSGQVCFHEEVSFRNAICECDAEFADVQFRTDCGFEKAQLDKISFHDCYFTSKLSFADASVEDELNLPSFGDTLNLRGTNFVNRPPELFGSDLKPYSDLASTLPAKPNPDHINIYEDLRQHAERLGKLEEKKRFVHAELSCRAIDPQKSPAERFVWWLYYITSDYGTSIYRPLGWLFVLFLMSAVPWVGYAIWFSPMSVWSAPSYNILHAVPFTGHLTAGLLGSDAFENLPMSLHFIAGPVALLNPIFWFLTGLGMRYKLRLAR